MCNFVSLKNDTSSKLREILLASGTFGDRALKSIDECLVTAFEDFKGWRLRHKVSCSQRLFRERHLVKACHGFYFTAKAFNARVVLEWLAHVCRNAAANDPGNERLNLNAMALILY